MFLDEYLKHSLKKYWLCIILYGYPTTNTTGYMSQTHYMCITLNKIIKTISQKKVATNSEKLESWDGNQVSWFWKS